MRRLCRSSLRIVLLLSIALLGLVPPAPAGASSPGGNGAIAFTLTAYDCREFCTNYSDIFITDPAGAKPPLRRAGSTERYDAAPDWSPNGNRIVFEGYPFGVGYVDIYSMAANGTDVQALTNNYKNRHPRWSPDGTTIAFTRENSDGWPELWLMDADGTNERKVPIAYYVNTLDWLPDGRITFWGNPNNFSVNGLFVTDMAGTDVDTITTLDDIGAATGETQSFPTNIDWSPTGHKAVFSARVPRTGPNTCEAAYSWQEDVWTVTPAGALAPLSSTSEEFDVWETDPVWSPNGARVAFSGYRYVCQGEGRNQTVVAGRSDLYTMRTNGTDVRAIVQPPAGDGYEHGATRPSWQPCTAATTLCGRGPGAGGFPIQDEIAPTVDDARRTVPQGARLSTKRIPVRFTWSGMDNETPADELRYDVQIRDESTNDWVPLLKNKAQRRTIARLLPGRTYRLRHRARDALGNTSPFLVSPKFRADVGEETVKPPALQYTGTWKRALREGAYGGYVRTSNDVDAMATATFTGYRGAGVVLTRAENLGVARVCLRQQGVDPICRQLDLSAQTDTRRILFAANKLDRSLEYRLQIKVISGRVDLDVFELLT